MEQKRMAATVLAHRDGRNKEHWKLPDYIVPLLRAAVKMAAVTLGLYILAAVAALNIPAVLLAILAENALLGIYYKLEAPRHADTAEDPRCI